MKNNNSKKLNTYIEGMHLSVQKAVSSGDTEQIFRCANDINDGLCSGVLSQEEADLLLMELFWEELP